MYTSEVYQFMFVYLDLNIFPLCFQRNFCYRIVFEYQTVNGYSNPNQIWITFQYSEILLPFTLLYNL